MDKILFSNSFKNLMVTLGAKTSDSSYAVPLINKTSGAPQGYMEMSALASVLGVFVYKGMAGDSGYDCDNFAPKSVYYINAGSTCLNKPDFNGRMVVFSIGDPNGMCQFAVCITTPNLYTRQSSVSGYTNWASLK